MPNGSGGGLQKHCRNPQYRKIAEVGSNPIPGSKIFCALGHETEVGFLKGKLISTFSTFHS
ncbi:MAG: hypothetical protein ABSF09_04770 [Candidatus Bathyarchaeia archaeon]